MTCLLPQWKKTLHIGNLHSFFFSGGFLAALFFVRINQPKWLGKNTTMWLKQCHQLAMTGNGKFIPHRFMVIFLGMVNMALF